MNKNYQSIFSSYLELTKPRITSLILVTTTIGFFLGGRGFHNHKLLFFTLLGAGLVCAGASALNQYLERDIDKKMDRTKERPIPMGVISANHALLFGLCLILLGINILLLEVNLLTAFLSLLTAFLYVLVYTPLKKLTWLNTSIGAIPGAIPPMGGWAAATGDLDLGAWVLFLILFLWQHPHFFAIAWMFKEDYRQGGLKMLPVIESDGKRTFKQINLFALCLIPVSMLPTVIGMSGKVYFCGAFILSVALFIVGFIFTRTKSNQNARQLLRASVIYLPILLFLIVLDVSF